MTRYCVDKIFIKRVGVQFVYLLCNSCSFLGSDDRPYDSIALAAIGGFGHVYEHPELYFLSDVVKVVVI